METPKEYAGKFNGVDYYDWIDVKFSNGFVTRLLFDGVMENEYEQAIKPNQITFSGIIYRLPNESDTFEKLMT
jgi:monoamine oxidase